MADTSDKPAVAIAARVAVARWRRDLDGAIGQFLNDADECVQEASLMNANLPPFMAKRNYAWETVLPREIRAAQIKKVRQYAGLVLKKMHRVEMAESTDLERELIVEALHAEGIGPSLETSGAGAGEPTPSRRLSMELFAAGSGLSDDDVAELK